MKKLIIFVMIVVMLLCSTACTGCSCNYKGYDFLDNDYHFDKAIIKLPNGEVKIVDIAKWSDAEGEQLTILSADGTRYLVSSINCVLIEEP